MDYSLYLHTEYRSCRPGQHPDAWACDGPAAGQWMQPRAEEPDAPPTDRESMVFGAVFAAMLLMAGWGVLHGEAAESTAHATVALAPAT